jgi:hypothetical protein
MPEEKLEELIRDLDNWYAKLNNMSLAVANHNPDNSMTSLLGRARRMLHGVQALETFDAHQ